MTQRWMRIRMSEYQDAAHVYLFEERSGRRVVGVNVELRPFDDGAMAVPTFTLTPDALVDCFPSAGNPLQILMDDLWHAGIRPRAALAGDQTVQAYKDHISDLRSIAFSALKVKT